jgi:hypothetical protein
LHSVFHASIFGKPANCQQWGPFGGTEHGLTTKLSTGVVDEQVGRKGANAITPVNALPA